MFSKKKYFLYYNIFFATILLIIIGTVFVLSSSFSYGIAQNNPTLYLKKHIIYLTLGFILVWVFKKVPLEKIETFIYPLFIFSLFLLPLPTLLKGERWIQLGPFSFQPSEIVKLTFIFFLAKYFKDRYKNVNEFKVLILPIFLYLLIIGLLELQKDYGSFVLITCIFLSILILCGLNRKTLLIFSAFIIGIGILFILPSHYRRNRIKAFINPFSDPNGIGYHIIQSRIAISSGGLFGKGLGAGTGKLRYIPESHKDYVYAVVAEELGFIRTVGILILFGIIVFSGFEVSKLNENIFEKILTYGISFMFGSQFLLHSGVSLTILPPKGTTFPFFSVGGSSLIVNMLSLGILLKIAENIANQGSLKDIEDTIIKI
ncbi:MAG: putative lipid II flippase FtsW [bacterium]|nr:putative lipid II flippase FtsW [bacterium]MDW8164395.1 putative peptidoglycan glycosyltransferase FtsW [Candidatus Omnitrophota bacterium]